MQRFKSVTLSEYKNACSRRFGQQGAARAGLMRTWRLHPGQPRVGGRGAGVGWGKDSVLPEGQYLLGSGDGVRMSFHQLLVRNGLRIRSTGDLQTQSAAAPTLIQTARGNA